MRKAEKLISNVACAEVYKNPHTACDIFAFDSVGHVRYFKQNVESVVYAALLGKRKILCDLYKTISWQRLSYP